MTRMIVITGFVIAFCAGAMSWEAYKSLATNKPKDEPPPSRVSDFERELKLTPEQQKQMKEIWSSMPRGGGRESWGKRNQIYRERDEALAKLIRPEDKPAYDQVLADTKQKLDSLDAAGKKAFEQMKEKTRAILTPEQRVKYEEMMSHGPGFGRDGPGREGPGRDNRGRDRPSTKPTETK